MEKPIAIIHKIGKAKCNFSNKTAEGALVTFQNGSVKRQFLSWAALRKLLEFTNVQPEASSGETQSQS